MSGHETNTIVQGERAGEDVQPAAGALRNSVKRRRPRKTAPVSEKSNVNKVSDKRKGGRPALNNVRVSFRVPQETRRRYIAFFKKFGEPEHGNDRLGVLLDLAETHPDLREEQQVHSSHEPIMSRDNLTSTPIKPKWGNNGEAIDHASLKRRKLVDSSDTQRLNGRTQFDSTVQRERSTRSSTPSILSTEESVTDNEIDDPTFQSTRSSTPSSLSTEESITDNEIADLTFQAEIESPERGNEFVSCGDDDGLEETAEPIQSFTMKGPGGQEIKYAAPLLSRNYYLRFSDEARQKRCSREGGDDRTVAQMANARRLLIERRQLMKLLSLVTCSKEECGELLDRSTMKCQVLGYACTFKALCRGKRHRFEWGTSSSVSFDTAKKKKVMTYTMNIVTPAAIILSGNGATRMKSFADALNLQWGGSGQHYRVQRSCVMPVIEKCTKIAQEDMFHNLRQQEGRIVLAGDGQFDSPGSCASSCTYSLAVAGIERANGEDMEFYPSGYVVSQGIVDRRHADDKSPAMEHIAMHTALRPLYNNKITVNELVTDGHSQVTASFKKVLAASNEKEDNLRTGKSNSEKMDQFIKMLQHHNLLTCSAEDAVGIHSFYAQIRHSVDTWHEGKNIRKRVKKISASAPLAERANYQGFAGYLQKHLWCCSEKANGGPEEFKERWLSSLSHVQGDHRKCEHSGVNKKGGVSPTTAAFGTLKKFITDIAKKAEQLCRFRHTGALETFHNVSLIYTSKRIFYDYDVMVMKKRLAVLHYNHNINRPWKYRENGEILFNQKWSKASKTHVPCFIREKANFDYIGHLMGAVLCERATGECDFDGPLLGTTKISPQHPRHIRRSLAPYAALPAETFKKWKTRYPAYRKASTAAASDVNDGEEVSEDDNELSSTDDDDDDDEDYNDNESSGDAEY